MKYKKLLIICGILTVVLYLVLVFITVFKVTDIVTDYNVYADDDFVLSQQILDSYKGQNMLFLDTQKIADEITDKTCFKVESIQKCFPFTLKVNLYSNEEIYAVEQGGEYYMLDSNYVVIAIRNNLSNPADNLSNVQLIFNTDQKPTLKLKEGLVYDEELFEALVTSVECFDSPRDHLVSATIQKTPEQGNYRIIFQMRTGVIIEIFKATENTKEKVLLGISKYNSLRDSDLICGKIECYELDSGKIQAVYTRSQVG